MNTRKMVEPIKLSELEACRPQAEQIREALCFTSGKTCMVHTETLGELIRRIGEKTVLL